MQDDIAVQSVEDCIKLRNLFLIHAGHSWFVIRVPMDDYTLGSSVPLPVLNKLLPKEAMINTIAKFANVTMLTEYLAYAKLDKDQLVEKLKGPLPQSEYKCALVFGIQGWGA